MMSSGAAVPEIPARRPGRRAAVLTGAVLIVIVLVVVGALLSDRDHHGAVSGSGTPAAEPRALPSFTAVELAGTNRVTVQVGTPQQVVVHADSNLLHRVLTQVRSGVLVVSDRGSFTTRSPMQVDVTVPSLSAATLSGMGTGDLTVTGVGTNSFTARLAGTGTLTASGRADRVNASLTGDGTLMLAALRAGNTIVAMRGTGTAVVYATGSLDATLAGTGTILYIGHPEHLITKVTGTGTITAR